MIVEIIGIYVCCDESTLNRVNMDITPILVRTNFTVVLDDAFNVNIDDKVFRIKMVEDSYGLLRIVLNQKRDKKRALIHHLFQIQILNGIIRLERVMLVGKSEDGVCVEFASGEEKEDVLSTFLNFDKATLGPEEQDFPRNNKDYKCFDEAIVVARESGAVTKSVGGVLESSLLFPEVVGKGQSYFADTFFNYNLDFRKGENSSKKNLERQEHLRSLWAKVQ